MPDNPKDHNVALAKERLVRHLVERGVDPVYAEGTVATHASIQGVGDGVLTTDGEWRGTTANLSEYADRLFDRIPTAFQGDGTAPRARTSPRTAEEASKRFNDQRAARPNPLLAPNRPTRV